MNAEDVRELRKALRESIIPPEYFVGGDLDGMPTGTYDERNELINSALATLESLYPEGADERD